MKNRLFFIIGTDTGVGKTVLTVALTRTLRQQGVSVAALKPFSSGDRNDARALRHALADTLTLDEINPWHFHRALAPRLAAEAEGVRITSRDVVAHIRTVAKRHSVTLIEGAGGLLSPLTADADAGDLITELGAIPVVISPNRLGAINQNLLVRRALPARAARQARFILMRAIRPDHSAASNLQFLRRELDLGANRVCELPRFTQEQIAGRAPIPAKTRGLLRAILGG